MFRRIPMLLTALCGLLLAQATEKLAGGPYVVNAGPDSATVVWILESSGGLRTHKIAISGLAPGRTYNYDVLGREEGRGSFRTPPVRRASFQFAVYGDTRTRHEVHQRVIDALIKTEPDFVLHTGDLVADGRNTAQWPVFFSVEKELLRKSAFFPSLGNHERNDVQFFEFFDRAESYYSFRWGNAAFIVLNSDLGNVAKEEAARQAFWEEQTRWLEQELEKSRNADFRFLVFHHPPFTAVKQRQGGNKHVQELLPLFEKHKVTAVFNGHDHNYQRHVRNGVHYVTTGGGGAPLYEVDAPIDGLTQKAEKTENFVLVKVKGRRARLEARAPDGRLIDEIRLKR